MRNRSVVLLAVTLLMLSACGPQRIERPLEGAPVGGQARATSEAGADSPPPTLAPASGPAPTASPAGMTLALPSPSPSPVPGYVIVATDGAGANMRSAPSTRAPVITTLREGTPVAVLGEPVNAEGRAWRQIQSGDRQGWVVAVVVRPR